MVRDTRNGSGSARLLNLSLYDGRTQVTLVAWMSPHKVSGGALIGGVWEEADGYYHAGIRIFIHALCHRNDIHLKYLVGSSMTSKKYTSRICVSRTLAHTTAFCEESPHHECHL